VDEATARSERRSTSEVFGRSTETAPAPSLLQRKRTRSKLVKRGLRVKVYQREREFRTDGGLAVRDITEEVREAVAESGIRDGIACVYSPHTTCCVRVNEFEQGFLEDIANMLRRLVPNDSYYAHDDWDRRTENFCQEDMEIPNGHAHCMAMLLGTAGESVPVCDGDLGLGTWQRVLFIELDRQRDRRWIVKVVGT
jgi:secondary thiamine-phosphate synthase enzyme